MNISKYMSYILPAMALTSGLLLNVAVQASEDGSADHQPMAAAQAGELYLPSADPLADLQQTLDSARESGKLALVILGGNWCHDSRALAARLFEEPLRTTIDAHYQVLFVDVGYLDQGNEVINRLGVPIYYATPTVLIVDPVSGHLVNKQNRHQWANAANIGMQESVDYFGQYAGTDPGALLRDTSSDDQLQKLLAEIELFEQVQADRLYRAYAVLGPMLKAYKEGDKEAFSDVLWNEVRDFRYQVPADVEALRNQARQRVAAGETGIRLAYPIYPAFSRELE
jgi:hypothetical protein